MYVGQSGDLKTRLAEHNKKKDFWQRACVVLSKTNSLTQTHALFLEWYCLQMADRVDRYTITNGHLGSKPYTPTPLQSDCLEIFEAAQVLLATLGFPIFEPLTPEPGQATKSEEYVCKAGGCDARGLYTPEGFVVLKGSVGRKGNVPSLAGTSDERFRAKLVESGVMREDGDRVVFEKDHLFGSPSMAAIAVLGRTANGWLEWKTSDGRTLDAVERSGA